MARVGHSPKRALDPLTNLCDPLGSSIRPCGGAVPPTQRGTAMFVLDPFAPVGSYFLFFLRAFPFIVGCLATDAVTHSTQGTLF